MDGKVQLRMSSPRIERCSSQRAPCGLNGAAQNELPSRWPSTEHEDAPPRTLGHTALMSNPSIEQ